MLCTVELTLHAKVCIFAYKMYKCIGYINLHVCMHLYAYIYMHTSICIHLYAYIHMHTSICIHPYAYIYMHTSICIHPYAYIHMHTSICIHPYAYIHMHTSICIHPYAYIHMHKSICIQMKKKKMRVMWIMWSVVQGGAEGTDPRRRRVGGQPHDACPTVGRRITIRGADRSRASPAPDIGSAGQPTFLSLSLGDRKTFYLPPTLTVICLLLLCRRKANGYVENG